MTLAFPPIGATLVTLIPSPPSAERRSNSPSSVADRLHEGLSAAPDGCAHRFDGGGSPYGLTPFHTIRESLINLLPCDAPAAPWSAVRGCARDSALTPRPGRSLVVPEKNRAASGVVPRRAPSLTPARQTNTACRMADRYAASHRPYRRTNCPARGRERPHSAGLHSYACNDLSAEDGRLDPRRPRVLWESTDRTMRPRTGPSGGTRVRLS